MAEQGVHSSDGPSRGVATTLALWLAVIMPIGTWIQLTYLDKILPKLPQIVVAAIALLVIGMITLSIWAAIGIWQRRQDARRTVEQALLSNVAASALGLAPLSILMSAAPSFLPTLLITLIALASLDALWPTTDASS